MVVIAARPKDLNEALKIAEEQEKYIEMLGGFRQVHVSMADPPEQALNLQIDPTVANAAQQLTEINNRPYRMVANDGEERRREGTNKCFGCGEAGHYRRECPLNKETRTCYHCGRSGHLLRDCNERKREQRSSPDYRLSPVRNHENQGYQSPTAARERAYQSPTAARDPSRRRGPGNQLDRRGRPPREGSQPRPTRNQWRDRPEEQSGGKVRFEKSNNGTSNRNFQPKNGQGRGPRRALRPPRPFSRPNKGQAPERTNQG